MKNLSLSIFILLSCAAYSQCKTINNDESLEIIKKGINLHEEKKYDEAIQEFKKIDRNDSSYYLAQIELVNTYQISKHDSLALEICDDIIANSDEYKSNALLYKANCYDNLNNFDEAVRIYKQGIELYPHTYGFYFELGLAYFRKEKYHDAYIYFVKTIKLNPYYSPAHLQMANLALRQQKFLSAILAYEFFLVNEHNTKRSQNIIVYIESILKGEKEQKEKITIEGISELDDFTEIESLLKSKIALTKQYKSKIDLNYDLTKQMQLISEKITSNKSDTGFYMQFYAPFFEELQKKNFFEPFTYTVLSGMKIPEIDKWVEKNKSKIEKYSNWAYNYIKDKHCIYSDNVNGDKQIYTHYFSNNHLIAITKTSEDLNNKNGVWYYFYDNGNLKSYGAYKNNIQTGVWHYYYANGNLKEISQKTNQKIEGSVEEYFENGIPKSKLNYTNGLIEGEQLVYHENGNIKGKYDFKNDKPDGKEIIYYDNNYVKYEVNRSNEKYEGSYKEYFISGNLYQEMNFENGEKTGKFISYFDNKEKNISSEGQYTKGNPSGEWKIYNNKKSVIQKGSYNNSGEKSGIWTTYYDNGKIKFEENFNDGGKLNGPYKYYAENGNIIEEFTYKNDVLTYYKQFDDKGKLLAEGSREKKKIEVKLFYPNGNIKKEGLVENNKPNNEWKFYNYHGVLTSKSNYEDGKYQGLNTEYYSNGAKRSEWNYNNNNIDGCYKSYHIDGTLNIDGLYVNDIKEGYWREFNPNQTLISLNYFKNGQLFGEQIYYSEKGTLDRKEYIDENNLKYKIIYYDTLEKQNTIYNYKLGKNEVTTKLHNGDIRLKYTTTNGVINGELLRYFPSGKIEQIVKFTNGLKNGESITYNTFGTIIEKNLYLNDELHGESTLYYDNGKIRKISNYENGNLQGKMKLYHENGQLQRELEYIDGKVTGISLNYDEAGQLMAKRTYFDGNLVSFQFNDKTGKLTEPVYVTNGNVQVRCFFQNGKPSLTYDLKNGELEGARKEYHSNGNLVSDENYTCGNNVGVEKIHYPSGKLKTIITFKNGKKNGPLISYYENGKTKYSTSYIAEKQFGETKIYSEDGKLIKTLYYFDDIIENEK